MEPFILQDRQEGGQLLAQSLTEEHFIPEDVVVLGIPRGGVILAVEVARALSTRVDVIIAKKIGAPHNPERAIGAIAEGNVVKIDDDALALFGIDWASLMPLIEQAQQELNRQVKLFRPDLARLNELLDKVVVIVDDGLATGLTALAAIESVKQHNPREVIVAVPVCARSTVQILRHEARVVCLFTPQRLGAIGTYYRQFDQVSDQEVVELLS